MLDLTLLRTNPEKIIEAYTKRGLPNPAAAVQALVDLDKAWRLATGDYQASAATLNSLQKEFLAAKQQNNSADLREISARRKNLGDDAKLKSALERTTKKSLDDFLATLPNIVLEDVPSGGPDANQEIRRWGTIRHDKVKPHWEIGKDLGLLDTERGVKISGTGFMAFREQGAALMRALFNLCLDMHTKLHGYEEVRVPSLVSARTLKGTGQLPKFQEDLYQVGDPSDDLYLIPTAEVPITNLYRDESIAHKDLPKGFVAHTSCFRREAGSHGKDTRGLLRLHEFDKVELVRYSRPEESQEQLEHLTQDAEAVLKALGLPYRVILLAAGDTGFASAKTYDLEVWAPGVGQWLEVSSCSTFGDFQARRTGLRYKDAQNKQHFLHTLNGSGLAFPRTIAAILEHYQQPDGSVIVPEALRPYLGTDVLRQEAPTLKKGLLRR